MGCYLNRRLRSACDSLPLTDKMDELCATDKTVRVHAEFALALERVAGIVIA